MTPRVQKRSEPRRVRRGFLLNKPAFVVLGAALFMLFTCSAPLVPSGAGIHGVTDRAQPGLFQSIDAPIQGVAQPESVATREAAVLQPTAAALPTPTLLPSPSPSNDQLGKTLDTYLTDMSRNGWFQGSVLVARNGTVLLAKGYGAANDGVNNSDQTVFRLASLTKQFTAVGILRLVEQGKLSLDDTICKYIDNCPESWQQVKIRHLLNHSSGIADYTDFLDYAQTEGQPATPEQLVARFRDIPLAFTPGDLYDYCNSGYVLLGMVIERVSGRSYGDYMQREVFGPLGMQHSGYDAHDQPNPDFAQGYSSVGQKTGFLNTTTLFAAGGLYSTVWDLYRWDQALYTEKLLSQPLLTEMFTPGNGSYGYGWKIERPNNRLRISHAGNMTGVSNFLARYPDDKLTVIVLSNMESTSAASISDYLSVLAMGN